MEKDDTARETTISDVALAAGVSTMTVSRVMNGQAGASAETRGRVLAAARRLNYRPNSFAKGLKSDRSQSVGIIVPDIVNPFFPEIIRGAELMARPAGYTLLSSNIVEDPAREEEVLEALLEKRVDGLIVCSARLEQERLVRAISRHRAVVLINRSVPSRIAGSIEIDYRSGIEGAIEHLLDRGRRRFAYASGPATSFGGRKRREGIDAALLRHGLSLLLDIPADPTLEGGIGVGEKLRQEIGRIDAIVCYNDLIALGLMAVLKAAGIAIPGDVAVVGCDDVMPAALVSPALTSLRVAKQDLGQMAMRMLLDRIAGQNTQQKIVIEPDLVVRETT